MTDPTAKPETETAPVSEGAPESEQAGPAAKLKPLIGEAGIPDVARQEPIEWSDKAKKATAAFLATVLAFSGATLYRNFGEQPDKGMDTSKASDRPMTAVGAARPLDLPNPSTYRVPGLLPEHETQTTADEALPALKPGGTAQTPTVPGANPQDAPVLVVTAPSGVKAAPQGTTSTAAPTPADPLAESLTQLQQYQLQLQGMLGVLAQGTGSDPSPPDTTSLGAAEPKPMDSGPSSMTRQLLDGPLRASTPRVAASLLGDRSLVLPKGTAFTCVLKTLVISATSGFVGCMVQRDIYSDNGRVLLIERGSHLDGEYQASSVRPGSIRIPVVWTRVRTPLGVTVDLESPATGPLGESGMPAHVDNRWPQRIGAALLLSLIDDTVQVVIDQQLPTERDNRPTVVLPSTTDNTGKLAEQVLETTVQLPPLLQQNQGGIVGITVARDIDFSTVYQLRPVTR